MKRHENNNVSAEQLNAYIDDELDFEERSRVVEQMWRDDHLTHEAQNLRQLQAMLRHAYRTPPAPPRHEKTRSRSRGTLNALAAGLLLAVGAVSGWLGNELLVSAGPAATANNIQGAQFTNTAATTTENLLLHISSNDPARMEAALNYAERTLAAARREQNRAFRLEVVANDGGVEMLRRDTSPFPERIERLLKQYDNVSFLACANALRKLREGGVKVELLPGTRSDHNAIDEIIHRIEGGWRYLKV